MEAMSSRSVSPVVAVASSTDGVVMASPDVLHDRAHDSVRHLRLALIARGRRARLAATVAVVFALAGVNVANHVLGWDTMWLGPVGALALLAFARWQGLSWHQLGLARHTHARGIRWGLGVIAVVGLVYLVGILLPSTRTAFLDARYHLPPAGALLTAFVMIPVGTILLEEVAFRSVLWGFLSRHARMWQVVLVSSLLFGLWHVFPAMASATGNPAIGSAVAGLGPLARVAIVGGTVLFTALGGVLAGELRRRSGSLFASVGMHWATNSLGVLFGVLAWRLTS
jgi:membrane protease YdiL (CAAX protease family)